MPRTGQLPKIVLAITDRQPPGVIYRGVPFSGLDSSTSATVTGDANQDDNTNNDRLPGVSRDSLVVPDYATVDFRLTRPIQIGDRVKLEFTAESFNLLNRDNQRVQITQDGLITNAAQFVPHQ